MLNPTTLKIQKTFQNQSKILEIWKFFITYKWSIIYIKVVAYYKIKHKNVSMNFW
jgi:hypothetical protein